MTVKEYLQQIHRLSEEIRCNRRRISEIESDISGLKAIDYSGDKVGGSGDPDQMASKVARLVDLEQRIADETVELQETKDTIIGEIRSMSNTKYVTLLTMRYVECERWERIAVDMNLTMRWVYQMHGNALKAFEEIKKSKTAL